MTLVEVMVAVAIVALSLVAGLNAVGLMGGNLERRQLSLLGQLCAENALVELRLARRLPDIGTRQGLCEQAGRTLQLEVEVQKTPNPSFRRVDVRVAHHRQTVVRLSTVVGAP